jgi:hypothetical protein
MTTVTRLAAVVALALTLSTAHGFSADFQILYEFPPHQQGPAGLTVAPDGTLEAVNRRYARRYGGLQGFEQTVARSISGSQSAR